MPWPFALALPLGAGAVFAPLAGEITLRTQARASLYDAAGAKVARDFVLHVTSHRLVGVEAGGAAAHQWPLARVEAAAAEPLGLLNALSSPKVVVRVRDETGAAELRISFKDGLATRDRVLASLTDALAQRRWEAAAAAAAPASSSSSSSAAAVAAAQPRASVFGSASTASAVAAAAAASAAPAARATPAAAVPDAGLAGLRARERLEMERRRAVAAEALQGDFAPLKQLASSLAEVAERYAVDVAKMRERRRLLQQRAAEAAGPAAAASAAAEVLAAKAERAASALEDEALQSMGALAGMGVLVSAVTREAAGSEYPKELARQLAGVLRPHLERGGGMMSLTDAYCLYNRARGTDLVSPEDLLDAARLLGRLGLGMRERTLDAGALGGGARGAGMRVVQLDSFSDESVKRRIEALLTTGEDVGGPGADAAAGGAPTLVGPEAPAGGALPAAGGRGVGAVAAGTKPLPYISAMELSRRMSLPPSLARQLLLRAEADALLCRDDSIAGLRFYLNRFVRR
jgi:ESCRT-II complex subunit VPS36